MRVMSADWTTCRVVRDRDGDLWFRGCDSDDLWTANTNYPDVFLTADELHTAFGPLTPVLDAEGLPVVTTVGDLGNVHLGRHVKYEGGGYGREGIYQGTTADYLERDRCNMHVGGGYEAGVPLDSVLVVDAGIGAPHHAAQVMELGYDAVLVNTAVAEAGDPVAMSRAFTLGVQAGRLAHRALPMRTREVAQASTPMVGVPFWHQTGS